MKYRKLLIFLAVAAFFALCCSTAYADSIVGWFKTQEYKFTYAYQPSITFSDDGVHAYMRTKIKDGTPIPPGYAGTDIMLFRSDGALIADSGMFYSSETSDVAEVKVSTSNPGNYYARGVRRLLQISGHRRVCTRI